MSALDGIEYMQSEYLRMQSRLVSEEPPIGFALFG
jgi:hypothetical protein